MAVEYAKVLKGLGADFLAVGRSAHAATKFQEATGCRAMMGGLKRYLKENPTISSYAIVAVGVGELLDVTLELISNGVKNILVEKPGGLNSRAIELIYINAKKKNAKIFIAYNRRFFSSVINAQKIINDDGGVKSFSFEFTEWSHEIVNLEKTRDIKDRWFLANSSHVADLAFFIGGNPEKISTYTSGKLSWHTSAAVFSGAGVSVDGALFSYQANWSSPGRWGVEVLTESYRIQLRPLEKLRLQKNGELDFKEIEIEDSLDRTYKPGLYLQTRSFLEGDTSKLCGIENQLKLVKIYNLMAAYND